jgi:hypothetical protein
MSGPKDVEAVMATAGTHRDFASLLDDLLTDEAVRRSAGGNSASSIDFLGVIDELGSGLVVPDGVATAGYREQVAEPRDEIVVRPAVEPQLPPPSTDPQDIARELGLPGRKNRDELDALRRRFALANHPDRVVPELRAVAMVRMQVANMLIDEAKRARR